eukprot:8923345-Lingulodinium_polyedra.AAC.1
MATKPDGSTVMVKVHGNGHEIIDAATWKNEVLVKYGKLHVRVPDGGPAEDVRMKVLKLNTIRGNGQKLYWVLRDFIAGASAAELLAICD